MNNEDFKNLLRGSSSRSQNGSPAASSTPRAGATPGASLGSRQRSSIPMTPRTVRGGPGLDFQRQLAEQRAGEHRPAKRFKSSAAPKGSRLAAGYTDRARARVGDGDDEDEDAAAPGGDDRARRVKALEESFKLGQIDQATFENLRDQITGGDVSATHLIKGLDRKLLERVRRGEDVLGTGGGRSAAEKEPEPDVEEEFEKLEEKEIAPVVREKKEKKGETALAGTKRTRDAILAELKAQRKAAAEAKAAAQPQLGSKFRRIGRDNGTFPRIERDDKGREVLLTLDEDGNVKRKVRKVKVDAENEGKAPSGLLMPDKDAKPLGMEVPEHAKVPIEEDEDDGDIFEGVGDTYDPLAGIGDDDSSDEDEEDGAKEPEPSESKDAAKSPSSTADEADAAAMPPPPKPSEPTSIPKTNYFGDTPSKDTSSITGPPSNPLTDPTILAAIRKARDINPEKLRGDEDDDGAKKKDPEEEARLKKRAEMLSLRDRDLEDMDMGFGSSRFDDAEDMEEETKIKLSEWKGTGGDDDDDEGGRERGGKQRKRGKKKRKGDKDSAADVLRVMEQRKSGK
ncbi:red-like protein [Diplodia corticola]|uniref:Red-like protein n=1 Tax=Diplodia corticola TaxID=236234 RepID=A0A1J9R942_9PEZI|nr:red-like protein [Diplodia corticola]OJD37017.1 red-like protein [Diplodia corticola]